MQTNLSRQIAAFLLAAQHYFAARAQRGAAESVEEARLAHWELQELLNAVRAEIPELHVALNATPPRQLLDLLRQAIAELEQPLGARTTETLRALSDSGLPVEVAPTQADLRAVFLVRRAHSFKLLAILFLAVQPDEQP